MHEEILSSLTGKEITEPDGITFNDQFDTVAGLEQENAFEPLTC
jgi:hypothetical protein